MLEQQYCIAINLYIKPNLPIMYKYEVIIESRLIRSFWHFQMIHVDIDNIIAIAYYIWWMNWL